MAFVRDTVVRLGPIAVTIQITEEPNVAGIQSLDGAFPRVREALVTGVIAARDEAGRRGFAHLSIGFNATPTVGPGAAFWEELGALGGDTFRRAVGYVGLDAFPGVFRPVNSDDLPAGLRVMVGGLLRTMRDQWLPAAGIDATVPIHITEHGWPTLGAADAVDRAAAEQATAVAAIVRTVHELRDELNVRRYELFRLRDADSAGPTLYHHFGLLRDDYSPKPAFAAFAM